MNQKMSGKQKIVEGFDLDAFVGRADPTEAEVTAAQPPIKTKPARSAGQGARTIAVQPTKPKADPLTERLQIKLTKAEMEKMKKAADLVPLSVYARKFMKDHGLI